MSGNRPIFAVYPKLAELPFAAHSELPTPVEPCTGLGAGAWVKYDDITGPEYGGNKVRKLEFVEAEIRQRKADHVVTFGATGTNAGVAAALMCARNGWKCTVLTFDQPDSPTVRENQRRLHDAGAHQVACHSLLRTALAYYLHPGHLRSKTYFLYAGCSNPVAIWAYVNAAFELKEQIAEALVPEPAAIFVPVGSSSTHAGLHLGVALAGLRTRVVGVRVAADKLGPFAVCNETTVQQHIDVGLAFLRRHNYSTPTIPPLTMWHDYFGEGYGIPTEAGAKAIARFAREGIKLEGTYTGKAAAAFLDVVDGKRGLPGGSFADEDGPWLFWNTFNSRP